MNNKAIYQIFVRNYSLEGNFSSVTKDIGRIKDLGVDIVYLMPISEIGLLNRKGKYGSPYAIRDYFSISKDLGTIDELKELINTCHIYSMKIILDMVFNHTSPDNVLLKEHRDYYYLRDGKPSNRVGDWSDIVDLNVEKKETQDYLLSVLKYWLSVGFDGFRFDVASIIPLSFFKYAREVLGKDVIFFAESVSVGFHDYLRSMHYYCEDDENLVPPFDLLYNYNYFYEVRNFLKDKNKDELRRAFEIINHENYSHPNILRSNCLENHDNDRVNGHLASLSQLKNLTAMFTMMRGYAFIYAGQEYAIKHKPELFEKDPVDWNDIDTDFSEYTKSLISLKKQIGEVKEQTIEEIDDSFVFKMTLKTSTRTYVGVFNLNENPVKLDSLNLQGMRNLITSKKIDSPFIDEPILFIK